VSPKVTRWPSGIPRARGADRAWWADPVLAAGYDETRERDLRPAVAEVVERRPLGEEAVDHLKVRGLCRARWPGTSGWSGPAE